MMSGFGVTRRLAAEALGTALLGNTVATGAMLVVLLTTLGPISGVHLNPAVSLGTPYDALRLHDPALSDDALLDAIETHPILINRPIVVTSKGVRLWLVDRYSERLERARTEAVAARSIAEARTG